MRDLTKAMTSYTWAMSVFGMQQMFNLLGLGGGGNRSTQQFENVTSAAEHEMGDTMRAVFRSGDTLQRGMVDLFLAPFSFGNWCGGSGGRGGASGDDRGRGWSDTGRGAWSDRGRDRPEAGRGSGWMDTAARAAAAGVDAMQAAVDTTARVTQRTAEAFTPGAGAQQPPRGAPPSSDPSLGWGPMPR